jgi:hypothetical protein
MTTDAGSCLLDLFSTSQKMDVKCKNNAPYICVPENAGKPGHLSQGCCNDWTCPRCGEMRARHEYGRMVEGSRQLAKEGKALFFITLTCNGTQSLQDAERTYLANTNRLLSAFRAQTKKTGMHWAYASVTERQRRGHPHSHYLITTAPNDAFCIIDDYERYILSIQAINSALPLREGIPAILREDVSLLDYHSEWLMLAARKAGLGIQARVSIVDSPEACSRYIAKYLFKQTNFEDWPKGWKRIRYSQNWPKLPESKNNKAFVVLTAWDWYLAGDSGELITRSRAVFERALRQGLTNVKFSDTLPN